MHIWPCCSPCSGYMHEHLLHSSLLCLVQTRGVHVTEVWGVEGAMPTSPMGTLDRSAASCASRRAFVYDVSTSDGGVRLRD
jgi:hypothetical protein